MSIGEIIYCNLNDIIQFTDRISGDLQEIRCWRCDSSRKELGVAFSKVCVTL